MIRIAFAGALLLAADVCMGQGDDPGAALRFSIAEGESGNFFIRENGISAHLNLQTQPVPRLVVAFPAGNSGGALFFAKTDETPVWGPVTGLRTVVFSDGHGHQLHGIEAEIQLEAASVTLEEADVGSVRFLRKAVDYSALPARAAPTIGIDGKRVHISRDRPDGQSAYVMDIELLAGELQAEPGLKFLATADGVLTLRVRVASGDPLETPYGKRPLNELAASDEALENALAFLTYEHKMLAGSWRFLTYFGRDTLLALRLLMPVLQAQTAEIGLGSVLERLNDRGEVAHEEEIGELAVYRNIAEHGLASAEPVYDYKMVDDNLLLLPVLDNYIETFGRDRAATFFAGAASAAGTPGQRVVSNLRLVAGQARAFAEDPQPANLIAIKAGQNVGNWRDSQEGLVGGRYPYDVNAVLMPAALYAAADIVGSGLLDDYADALPPESVLRQMAAVWEANAYQYFEVFVPTEVARERLAVFAKANGYPLPAVPGPGVSFSGIALADRFEPVPVMHSDIGTDLLFLHGAESRLQQVLASLVLPFPAGLATPVGILAANPAYAGDEARALVTRNHYHGTVIWSWQQAMIVAGIDEQLRRDDLSEAIKGQLRVARQTVWRGISASDDFINSELWSFEVRNGQFVISPFGQGEGHLTESNAVQLWSTVFLALQPDP